MLYTLAETPEEPTESNMPSTSEVYLQPATIKSGYKLGLTPDCFIEGLAIG
jgi:hypothetical protein